MTYTVGRLARRFGLSRTTLLYYDGIGLLKPAARGGGEYRTYGDREVERLEQICRYRKAGMALSDIRAILDAPEGTLSAALEKRFAELDREIEALRSQQRFVARLLRHGDSAGDGFLTKARWVSLLSGAGFTPAEMRRWHEEFERSDPEGHQRFLSLLRIPPEEIRTIRSHAGGTPSGGQIHQMAEESRNGQGGSP